MLFSSAAAFDKERQLNAARLCFVNTVSSGRKYAPCITLFLEGQPMVYVCCRPYNDDKLDKDKALVEMFATIAVVKPDHVLFSVDTWWDIQERLEDFDFSRMRPDRKTSALYSVMISKYAEDFTTIEPYFVDNEGKIWWAHSSALDIEIRKPGEDDDLGYRSLIDFMKMMIHLEDAVPINATALFDTLVSLGHRISVHKRYYPD